MENLIQLLYWFNIAWLMAHELDAVHQHEWRVLPLTSWMNERWGYVVFVLAHIPLLTLLIAASESVNIQIIFNVFLMVHVGLHVLFRNHPQYTFDNVLSRFLIVGVVPFALLHLTLVIASETNV